MGFKEILATARQDVGKAKETLSEYFDSTKRWVETLADHIDMHAIPVSARLEAAAAEFHAALVEAKAKLDAEIAPPATATQPAAAAGDAGASAGAQPAGSGQSGGTPAAGAAQAAGAPA
jgi:F0F1-type ATP synthase membrane subunit b/b'